MRFCRNASGTHDAISTVLVELFFELSQTMHVGDDVQTITDGFAANLRWSHSESLRHPDTPRITYRFADAFVRRVFEPDVYVPSGRVSALQHGRAQSDDHEAHAVTIQRFENATFTFG